MAHIPIILCCFCNERIMPGGTYKYLNNNRGKEPRYKRICSSCEKANAGAELVAAGWFLPGDTWTVKPIYQSN